MAILAPIGIHHPVSLVFGRPVAADDLGVRGFVFRPRTQIISGFDREGCRFHLSGAAHPNEGALTGWWLPWLVRRQMARLRGAVIHAPKAANP